MIHSHRLIRRFARWAALLALPLSVLPAQAQGSGEPLRLIIPFAAGATIDAVGRTVAQKYTEISGHTVVVDNRTGAGGILGTTAAAKSKPDGHTIVLVANNFSTTPAIRSDLPFNASKDFAPIAMVGYVPYAIVVPADSPSNSIHDLFEAARASKQPVNYGTLGVGSHGHFIGTQMAKATGAPMMQVPFKGQTEMMVAVMGGHLQMAVLNLSIAVKQMQEKRVKVLATLTEKRHPLTPQIPTFSETAMGRWWRTLVRVPSRRPVRPRPRSTRCGADITAAVGRPDVKAKLTEMGIMVTASGHLQFGQVIDGELMKYTRIAREANIRAE